jgi:hypothetical protein
MNLIRMKQFLKKYINDKYKNNLIIMDNGGSHKSKEIGKYIEKTDNKDDFFEGLLDKHKRVYNNNNDWNYII